MTGVDLCHPRQGGRPSACPGLARSLAYGRYPSRAQVVDDLKLYAARFGLKPVLDAETIARSAKAMLAAWRPTAGTGP